jgi:hypothetical protein
MLMLININGVLISNFYHFNTVNRLTLTWDVLKCSQFWTDFNFYKGLTLTWDVLKLLKLSYPCSSSIGLTLTWDVLKCI